MAWEDSTWFIWPVQQLGTQTCPNCQRQRVPLSLQSQAPCPQAAGKSGGAACSRHCLALPHELQGQNTLELRRSGCHLSQDKAVGEKDATERLRQQSSFFAESKHNSRRSPTFKGTESDLLLRKQQNFLFGLKIECYTKEIIFGKSQNFSATSEYVCTNSFISYINPLFVWF